MKITIDTEKKTAVVHGAADFEEVVNVIKSVCPVGWNSYRLTCENVSISDYGNIGTSIQKQKMFDSIANLGWDGELLPKNTVRDLTFNDYTNDHVINGQHLICKR